MAAYNNMAVPGHTITVSGAGTGTTWANGTATLNTHTQVSGKLTLEGKDADIMVNGVSMLATLDAISKRLAVLQPDPRLLKKYQALQEAYDHYRTMEALLYASLDSK